MTDIRLPSGKIIKGIPEGTSKEEIRRKAIAAGLATEADFGIETKKALPQTQQRTAYQHPSDVYMAPQETERMGLDIGSLISGMGQGAVDLSQMVGLGKPIPTVDQEGQLTQGEPFKIPEIAQDPRSRALRASGEWLTPLPGAQIGKADLAISGLAGAGEYLGGEIGQLAGGITGAIGTMLGKPKVTQSNVQKAQSFIREYSDDADTAIANLKGSLERGEKGSLAQLTRDPNLANLESTAKKGSPLRKQLDEINQNRFDWLTGNIEEKLGPEIPYRAMEDLESKATVQLGKMDQSIAGREKRALGKTLGQIESQLPTAERELAQAQEQLQQTESAISTPLKPSQASEKLSRGFSTAERQYRRSVEKPAWDKFSGGQKLDVEEVIEGPMGYLDNLNPTELKMVTGDQNQLFDLIRGWSKNEGGVVEPDEVHTVISQMKAKYNKAKADGPTDVYDNMLNQMRISLEKSLVGLGDKASYDKAVSATKEKHKRFGTGRIGKQRIAERGDPLEQKTFASRLFSGNEEGAVIGDLLKQAKSPALLTRAETYIKSVVQRDGLDEKFLNNYDELLDRFPEFKGQLDTAKKAQDALTGVQEKVASLPKTIETQSVQATRKQSEKTERLTKSIANKQISKLANNPEKFLDESLKHRSAKDLTKLNKQMGSVEGGKEALKVAIKERVLNKIVKRADGDNYIPPESVGEFNAIKRNLVDSGILTKDEVISIEKSIADAKFTTKFKKAAAEQKASQAETIMKDMFASGLAIQTLNFLPTAQNQLMLAGLVRRSIGKLMGKKYDPATISAVEDIITNPEKFLADLPKGAISDEQQMMNYINRIGKAVSQSVAEDNDNE